MGIYHATLMIIFVHAFLSVICHNVSRETLKIKLLTYRHNGENGENYEVHKSSDGFVEAVFVQENILKYFEPDATFRGKKHNSPLYVYELGKLVGVIYPVIYKE